MGLIDISNEKDESQGKTYLYYKMCDKMLKLLIVNFTENPVHFFLNISKESTAVKRWAQNLQQSPEKYLDQFYDSLQAKALDDEESTNVVQTKNIYEINEDSLVWRQYFIDKKMFGRRGKFTLEKVENLNISEQIMDNLVKDIKFKDKSLSDLEKQSKILISEKDELLLIAKNSVKIKEDLEKNLYKKFATLLNAKKILLSQYRKKLYELQEQSKLGTSHSRSGQSVENMEPLIPKTSNAGQQTIACSLSDDDYDDDTDVDSPQEVEHQDKSNAYLKRKDFSSSSGSEFGSKKAKSSILPLDESQDLLNASLEMELDSGAGKNNFRKFMNM